MTKPARVKRPRNLVDWVSMTKVCPLCNKKQHVFDFGFRRDGRTHSECRDCHNIRTRVQHQNRRLNNLNQQRAIDRAKFAKRTSYPKVNKVKQLARFTMRNAVRTGLLIRPKKCQKCGGSKGRIEGHHHDYNKPLEVKWLCSLCHGKEHRRPIQQIQGA